MRNEVLWTLTEAQCLCAGGSGDHNAADICASEPGHRTSGGRSDTAHAGSGPAAHAAPRTERCRQIGHDLTAGHPGRSGSRACSRHCCHSGLVMRAMDVHCI